MERRAAERGETYTPLYIKRENAAKALRSALLVIESNPSLNAKERRSAKRKAEAIAVEEAGGDCDVDELMAAAAAAAADEDKRKQQPPARPSKAVRKRRSAALLKLQRAMEEIDADEGLNSKMRRSARKKAEAIAVEESGCSSLDELQSSVSSAAVVKSIKREDGADDDDDDDESARKKKKPTPYVLFVGQLSYTTTKESLFHHFRNELGREAVTTSNLIIRLLTDKETNTSRGMAFVELSTPELMYDCLKLHQTTLDGRRINVHKSFGGGKERRKEKAETFRQEQRERLGESLKKVFDEFKERGDLEEGELDDWAIGLCHRHAVGTVAKGLEAYVEKKKEGMKFNNASAYLTHVITRISNEGLAADGGGSGNDRSSKRQRTNWSSDYS